MMDTEKYIYDQFYQCIRNWDKNIIKDIYALSLLIQYTDDDLKKPTLTISFNTFQKFDESIKYSVDENEAKWNFLFIDKEFLHPNCKEICKNMIPDQLTLSDINYSNREQEKTPIQTLDYEIKVSDIFTKILVRIVRRLHTEGSISHIFGKTIPIIIHESLFDPELVIQTIDANPPGITDEFAEWVIFRNITEVFKDWKERVIFLSESKYEDRFSIYDYLNDMDKRQTLEEWLMIATKKQRYKWNNKIISVDSILKKITKPVRQCIWGEENGMRNNWNSSENWWYYRRPKEVLSGWGWEDKT